MYIDLIFNLSLLVALSVVSGFIVHRWPSSARTGALMQGVLFGGAAVLGMLHPLALGPGLIFDGRSVMISLCALFFGPWAAVPACLMALALRFWMDGQGLLMGELVILSSMGIGLFAHYRFRPQTTPPSASRLYLFGLAVHLTMLALMFTLPADLVASVLKNVGPPVILLYPLATILAGKILSDITERKRSEALLQESNARTMQILNSAAEGIYGLDLEGNCTFCNPSGIKALGYQHERDLVGRNMHELVHHTKADGSPFPKDECLVGSAQHSGKQFHRDRELLWRSDGSNFYAEYWAHPLLKNNTVQGTVVSFVDRTEQIALENQLRHAQKMEAIGTLAGGIAHDFNNILSAIIGYGHITLMKMKKDDPLRLNLVSMLDGADRAAALTKGLLAFSRKQVLDRKIVDLNEILTRVEKFLARVIGEDVEVRMALRKGVMAIFADAGQLEQVFMNLGTNARDAMPKGGSLTFETAVTELDNGFIAAHGYGKVGTYAVISATDTGLGMDEATRKRIFEPFFTTKEVGKGTGLGLAMVYGIIKQHEGFINVYSEPGKGTTFRIYLPLIAGAAVEEKIAVPAAYPKGGTETILVAEDDPNLRKLTMIILEQAGYTVLTAKDGEEAVAKFLNNKDRIQLLLFDMIMPKKSGKEALDEIRTMASGVPVLFVSGYSPDMLRQKALIEDGAEVVFKPISPQKLLEKVREALDRGSKTDGSP